MRKLIIKTALIAFASAIGALGVFVGVCMLFFPSFVSDSAYDAGMYKLSVTFAERAYEKDGDTESLQLTVERAVKAGEYAVIVRYTPLFIEAEQFNEIAKAADEGGNADMKGGYADYIFGSYAVALYRTGDRQKALDEAFRLTERYVKFNPVERLMAEAVSQKDKELAATLKQRIEELTLEGEQKVLADSHVKLLNGFLA